MLPIPHYLCRSSCNPPPPRKKRKSFDNSGTTRCPLYTYPCPYTYSYPRPLYQNLFGCYSQTVSFTKQPLSNALFTNHHGGIRILTLNVSACECTRTGSLNVTTQTFGVCDLVTGQCRCALPGIIGRTCDVCAPGTKGDSLLV